MTPTATLRKTVSASFVGCESCRSMLVLTSGKVPEASGWQKTNAGWICPPCQTAESAGQ